MRAARPRWAPAGSRRTPSASSRAPSTTTLSASTPACSAPLTTSTPSSRRARCGRAGGRAGGRGGRAGGRAGGPVPHKGTDHVAALSRPALRLITLTLLGSGFEPGRAVPSAEHGHHTGRVLASAASPTARALSWRCRLSRLKGSPWPGVRSSSRVLAWPRWPNVQSTRSSRAMSRGAVPPFRPTRRVLQLGPGSPLFCSCRPPGCSPASAAPPPARPSRPLPPPPEL